MRRPVSVKPISCFPLFLSSSLFLLFPYCSHRAKPPLSPPFHPHSLLSDCRSVQVGCTRFSRCCYLISDLCFPPCEGNWSRHCRSHLISAVALGCLDTISLLSFFLLLFLSSCLSQFCTEKFRARIAWKRRSPTPATPSIPCFVGSSSL